MRARLTSLSALALFVGGCAQNGILEIELHLPKAEEATSFVLVSARFGEGALDESEAVFAVDLEGVDGAALQKPVDVVADSAEQMDRRLQVRLRFCEDRGCEAPPLEERIVTIERGFYVGERTFLTLCAPPMDCTGDCSEDLFCSAAENADRGTIRVLAGGGSTEVTACEVRGCVAGRSPVGYCRTAGEPSTHYCL